MQPALAHELRNVLAVILGGIQIGNLQLAVEAVHKLDALLPIYQWTGDQRVQ